MVLFYFLNQIKSYLNNLPNFSQSQLKSEVGRLHRYTLIKNIEFMKKFIGWSILITTIMICVFTSIVANDSRTYFKDYFESKRKDLNLRSEKSVDSLINVINFQNKKIDSFIVVDNYNKYKSQIMFDKIKTYQIDIKNLNNKISQFETSKP